jgi:hypothetical protein
MHLRATVLDCSSWMRMLWCCFAMQQLPSKHAFYHCSISLYNTVTLARWFSVLYVKTSTDLCSSSKPVQVALPLLELSCAHINYHTSAVTAVTANAVTVAAAPCTIANTQQHAAPP